MKYRNSSLIAISFIISNCANAALVSRLNGQAFYDTEANLTWLADASLAQTSGFDIDGKLTWNQATDWAKSLTIGGIAGWRLPTTLVPDESCVGSTSGLSNGLNCSGSELGNMYSNVLGNTSFPLSATGPFSNLLPFQYWSSTEVIFSNTPDALAYAFNFDTGFQNVNAQTFIYRAWAVRTGDVSSVPLPAATWFFVSGLLGLIGFARTREK